MDPLKPKLSETVRPKVQAQKRNHDLKTRLRVFEKDNSVYVKDFPNSKKWVPGKLIEGRGPLSYLIELNDGRKLRCHVDLILSKYTWTISSEGGDSNTDEIPVIIGPNDFSSTVAESAAASDIESPSSAHSEGLRDATNAELIVSSEGQPETSMEVHSQEMENTPSTPPKRTSNCYRQPPNRYGFSKNNGVQA